MKWFALALFLIVPLPAFSGPPERICSSGTWGPVECIRKAHFAYDICNAIERFAAHNDLDPHFFARLIWQESRFDAYALSPAGAQGIAQFMPHTAQRRGLGDSYNPAEALEHSARYLSEMARTYGSLGLAAVGYNGGERRAEGLIAGTGGLAQETVDYVRIITGVPHQNWLEDPKPAPDLRLSTTLPFAAACFEMARTRRITKLKPVAPAIQPWGIQMAFGLSKKKARAKFERVTRACSGLIKGQKPDLVFEKSRASPNGGYFMARLGRDSRDQAWRDCAKMKKQGCICAVYRND
ncbi:lytic transglycosylase domain-containing protein [Roseovarius sp. 2305UL8-3]|uniref:lytic transglycosylase domain-containing protein n=1 Tax=Roseovarius conchicola TaxID=3121636 RepID=UPI003527294C